MRTRLLHTVLLLPALVVLWALGMPASALAQGDSLDQATAGLDEEIAAAGEEGEGIFSVKFIELTVFGGPFWGARYLELPPLGDELTSDTGASDILDFQDQPLRDTNGRPIEAPEKDLEDGNVLGFSATFYPSDRFGFQLRGTYAQTEAAVTGLNPPSPDLPEAGRYEWDRTDLEIFQGGAGMIYQLGNSPKLRPFVTLGMGGLINSFPEASDSSALYFQYGGGVRYPLGNSFVVSANFTATLYTFDTEEVLLDRTLTIPSVNLGLTWRHTVPPPTAEEIEEAARAREGR